MPRRKKQPKFAKPRESTAEALASDSPASELPPAKPPSAFVRRVVSGLIVAQFSILLLSLSANLSASYLQGLLTDFLSPYLVTTGQDYGAVPIELTHAEPIDFPMRIDIHDASDPSEQWRSVPLPGVAVESERPIDWTRSRWCNLSRIVRLIMGDFPDSEIPSEFAAQVVRWSAQGQPIRADAVRIAIPFVPSFDEFEYVADGQSSRMKAVFEDRIIFTARLLHTEDGQIAVVPQQAAARTSKSLQPSGDSP